MPRLPLFLILYSSSYTLLLLVLLGLLLITPGDAIAQTLTVNKQFYNIFIVAGIYLLVAVVSFILYLSRVLAIRRLLASIPNAKPPVMPNNRTRQAVKAGLEKAARLTARVRPRGTRMGWTRVENDEGRGGRWIAGTNGASFKGWAPPDGELDGVEYIQVIHELPNILQERCPGEHRPPQQSLRAGLAGLVARGLCGSDEAAAFLGPYEAARWRRKGWGGGMGVGVGVEEEAFRALMVAFSRLLRNVEERNGRWDGDSHGSYRVSSSGGGYEGYGYGQEYSPDINAAVSDDAGSSHGGMGTTEIMMPSAMLRRRRSSMSSGDDGVRLESAASGRGVGLASGSGGAEDVEMEELTSRGRRRLSLRASSGTFG